MTLRSRLTLLTSGLIAVMAVLLGLAAFTAARVVQLETVDRTLAAALANPRVRALETRLPALSLDTAAVIGLARLVPTTGELRVLQTAGTATDPVPFPALTDEQLSAAATAPITVAGPPSQRVAVREVRPGRLTVVAAFPLTDVEQAQRRLAVGIAISVALVSIVGAVLAWLLVRRSLQPVDDIAEAATAIASGDLTVRIPEGHGGSEVAQLATALNAMIAELTDSLDHVQASEDRLRRFVSDASHEIRTPLTVISGYAELLQRTPDGRDPLEIRAVARIQSEAARLERLVTQLLLLERLERADSVDAAPVDLAAVVAEGLGDLCLGETPRPLELDLTHAVILGDPEDWRQVMANIAQNIERHTPAGSPVHAALREVPEEIVLTVDDAGPGIPADQRAAALNRFARTDASRSRGTGGFGLGMSIIHRIVQAHGGELELGDSPLGGLRVRISLPRYDADPALGSLAAGL